VDIAMPLHTRDDLEDLLDSSPRTSLTESAVTVQKFGPGELDTWSCFMMGNDACWSQKQVVSRSVRKPKVIISNALIIPSNLCHAHHNDRLCRDLALISALVENYDVYFWPGDAVPFSHAQQIRTSDEFLRLRHSIAPSTEEKVKRSLVEQQISTREFRILDYARYESVKCRLHQMAFLGSQLDLGYNIVDDAFLQVLERSVDRNKIAAIELKYSDASTVKKLMSIFPRAQRIVCYGKEESFSLWNEAIQEANARGHHQLTLQVVPSERDGWKGIGVSRATVPIEYKLERSIYSLGFNLSEKGTGLRGINNCPVWEMDKLQKEAYGIGDDKGGALVPLSPELKELTLLAGEGAVGLVLPFELSRVPNVTSLRLHSIPLSLVNVTQLNKLTHLAIRACQEESLGFLSSLPRLTHLELSRISLKEDFCAGLANLEDLRIAGSSISELRISCPKIKRLHIENCNSLRSLDLSQFPDLEELYYSGPLPLDLSPCRKLKRVTIIGATGPSGTGAITGVSSLTQLEYLVMKHTPVPDITPCLQLRYLELYANITFPSHFDLSKHSELEVALLEHSTISHVSMQNLAKLRTVSVVSEAACRIELNNNPLLNKVRAIAYQDNVTHLEGCAKLEELEINGDPLVVTGLEDCIHLKQMAAPAGFKLPDGDMELLQQNDASPVSLCGYQDDAKLDADTALSTAPRQYSNTFSLVLEEKGHVDRHHYRQQICESFQYDVNSQKISFSFATHKADCKPVSAKLSLLDDKKLHTARCMVAKDATQGVGCFTGKFVPGKLYSLATLDAMQSDSLIEVSCHPPDAIQLHYHERHKQFYLEVPLGSPPQEIKVLYRYKRDALQGLRAVGEPVESKHDLLPPAIRNALAQEVNTNPELAFIQDAKKSQCEKILALENYIKGFTNVALTAQPTNDIEALIATIRERRGACRHRARAFMALAHFMSISARVILNEQHEFCEVPYPLGPHRVDLGGASIVDMTPLHKRANVFATPVVAPISTPDPAPAKKMDTPSQAVFREHYKKEFKKISGITPLTSLDELFKPSSFHPVLEVENEKDLERVRDRLVAAFRAEHKHKEATAYLDIRGPEDLHQYFECYDIKDKQRVTVRGPLKTILEQGGVLLIDWSRFTPAQIANFKSLIDRSDANLMGQKVSAGVRAIGFTRKNTQTCSAFLSRCQKYVLTPALQSELAKDKQVERKSSQAPIIVNLFYQSNWYELLFGRVAASKSGLELTEGALFEAMRTNRPLHVYCAPNDEILRIVKDKINRERRWYRGGAAYDAGDEFELKLFDGPPPQPAGFTPVNNIIFTHKKAEDVVIPSRRIYVGAHNWHELFSRLAIEDKQRLPPLPGLLEEEKSVFYITNSLSKSEWSKLLAYTNRFPSRQFCFELAPQTEIEGVEYNAKAPERVPITSFKHDTSSFIATNDPNLVCEDIIKGKEDSKDSKVLLVTLTPEMGYHNLIASTTHKQDATTKQMEFNYEEHAVLTALKAGKTVILKGDVSPAFYQRLLPLLSDPPHLESNGQRIEVTGKLICVVPRHTLRHFPFHPVHEYYFSEKDYQHRCAKEDVGLAATIQTYFRWLNRMPQIEPQELTFARLKNIIARIKNPALSKVHSHNPIKEFLLEYFPKGEPTESAKRENYSYMNVLGKYLFKPHDDAPRRQKKLLGLHIEANLTNPQTIRTHVWRILNCFNGAELHRLFKDDLSVFVDCSQESPTLTHAAFERLSHYLAQHLADEVKEEKKSQTRIEKTRHYIQEFMKVGESKILVFTGMPGRGKTHAVDELKKAGGTVYRGRDKRQLENWLKHVDDGKPCYLELSEYNMASEGSWDFLEGITKQPPVVWYEGTPYTLSPNHWIIATGNPAGFEGRQAHSLFQQQSIAIPFTMSEDSFLENTLLRPRLVGVVAQSQSGLLLQVFNLIKRHNPIGYYSYRDLQNLAARVNLLLKDAAVADIPSRVYEACEVEFAGAIARSQHRNAFLAELKQLWVPPILDQKSELVIEIARNKFIPIEAECAIKNLQHAARMREEKCLTGKQIILLEGDPGVGKSALIDVLFATARKINVGDGELAKAALRDAFARRQVISLEEFNLDEDHSVEELLIQLLEKEQQNIEAGDRPDQRTLIVASQNSVAEQGRSSISLAMQNRAQHVYINTYSRASLQAVAERRGVEEPEVFVDVYLSTPGANMRMFYRELDLLDEQRVEAEKQKAAAALEIKKEEAAEKERQQLVEEEIARERDAQARKLAEEIADQKTLDESFSNKAIDEFKESIASLKYHGAMLECLDGAAEHGTVACQLAEKLTASSDQFFRDFPKVIPSERVKHYQAFEKEFTTILHSKDASLSTHRSWKPLIGNIAVALTGLGFLVLLGRLIFTAAQGNVRGLFRTQREVHRDEIVTHLMKMKGNAKLKK
jgi:hypothetical protein